MTQGSSGEAPGSVISDPPNRKPAHGRAPRCEEEARRTHVTQTHQPKNGRRRAERAHAQPRNTEPVDQTVASERERVAFLLPRRESFCKMGSPQKARTVSPTVVCTGCASPGGSRSACPSPALQAAGKVQTWPPGPTLRGCQLQSREGRHPAGVLKSPVFKNQPDIWQETSGRNTVRESAKLCYFTDRETEEPRISVASCKSDSDQC